MAHLTDMEELLASIETTSIRDYMREAMNCYMASAYRGCIVLSYIALFDDLLAKLGALGKVNKSAKKIFDEASKKKTDQDVFESYLIDQLSASNLLSGLDTAFLSTLRVLRNKSAHPSGHKPSSEEARFIFFEVVSRFLSRPILSTTQLVDELILRLGNANFFPSGHITNVQVAVEEELESLHPEAIPQLVVKMTNAVVSSDTTISKNAGFFLSGLGALDSPEINKEIQAKVIQAKSDDTQYSLMVLRLLTSNGKLISGVSKTCLSRVKQIISDRIDTVKASFSETRFSHPTAVFVSLSHQLDDTALLSDLKPVLTKLFDKRPYSEYLLSGFDDHPKTFDLYFSCILKKAGSSTFDEANAFAYAVENLDRRLSELMSDMQAFEIVVAVLQAANRGAFGSQGLRGTKFKATPGIREKVIAYASSNKAAARALLKENVSIDMKISDFTAEYLDANADA